MGSRSTSRTTQNITEENYAFQDVGIGVGSAGGDVTVETTDHGVVDRGFDFAERSLESVDRSVMEVGDTAARALDFGTQSQRETSGAQRQAMDFIGQAVDQTQQLARSAVRGDAGEVTDTARMALIVAGVGVGAVALILIFRR